MYFKMTTPKQMLKKLLVQLSRQDFQTPLDYNKDFAKKQFDIAHHSVPSTSNTTPFNLGPAPHVSSLLCLRGAKHLGFFSRHVDMANSLFATQDEMALYSMQGNDLYETRTGFIYGAYFKMY